MGGFQAYTANCYKINAVWISRLHLSRKSRHKKAKLHEGTVAKLIFATVPYFVISMHFHNSCQVYISLSFFHNQHNFLRIRHEISFNH